MKPIYLIISTLFLQINVDDPKVYFPLEVGNWWEFGHGYYLPPYNPKYPDLTLMNIDKKFKCEILKDTLVEGGDRWFKITTLHFWQIRDAWTHFDENDNLIIRNWNDELMIIPFGCIYKAVSSGDSIKAARRCKLSFRDEEYDGYVDDHFQSTSWGLMYNEFSFCHNKNRWGFVKVVNRGLLSGNSNNFMTSHEYMIFCPHIGLGQYSIVDRINVKDTWILLRAFVGGEYIDNTLSLKSCSWKELKEKSLIINKD